MYVLGKNSLVTSGNKEFTATFGNDAKEVSAPTITLDDLLDSENVPAIDFMTIDIELWEPKALAGFDIRADSSQPSCVSRHTRKSASKSSTNLPCITIRSSARTLRADTQNIWDFMPRS